MITRTAALTCTCALLTMPLAADVETGWYLHPSAFEYEVSHMPDLDQRRTTLPGDGGMYCVPTSTMNLLAYAANHGFSSVSPGIGYWQSQALYPQATFWIELLGTMMGTDPDDGTYSDGWHDGLEAWLANSNLTFQQDWINAAGYYMPQIAHLAQHGVNGGVAAFAYGRYEWADIGGNIVIDDRVGGHVVTLQHAKYVGFDRALGVRDPADDSTNSTQSTFKTKYYDTTYETVRWQSFDPVWTRTAFALNFNPDTSTRMAVIDEILTIYPKSGYSFTDSAGVLQIVAYVPIPLFGSNIDPVRAYDLPFEIHPEALVIDPDQCGWHVLQEGQLFHINATTGDTTELPAPDGAQAMTAGRKRTLYFVTFGEIVCVPVDDPNMQPTASLRLPEIVDSVAFDPADDEVVLSSWELPFLFIYPDSLPAGIPPEILEVPDGVLISPDYCLAIAPPVSADMPKYWISDPGSPVISGFNGEGEDPEQISVEGIGDPTCISFDDQGHLFVSTGAEVKELRRNGPGDWTEVSADESYFGGISPGPFFAVSRSRTNYDPALHDGPGWENIQPDEVEDGTFVFDCIADVNGDGVVNVNDMLVLFAEWGPCPAGCASDVNGDGQANVDDLLLIFATWGDCDG